MNTLSLFNPTFTSDLFDVMNKTMIDFLPAFTDGNPPTAKLTPKIDVRETKDSYLMEMDLPGRTENDVEINLKDHVLSISSKIEEKKEEKKMVNGSLENARAALLCAASHSLMTLMLRKFLHLLRTVY